MAWYLFYYQQSSAQADVTLVGPVMIVETRMKSVSM